MRAFVGGAVTGKEGGPGYVLKSLIVIDFNHQKCIEPPSRSAASPGTLVPLKVTSARMCQPSREQVCWQRITDDGLVLT
jgi:hypothetical protein